MRRFKLKKIEEGSVHFFDENQSLYVESVSDVIQNGLIEFFDDDSAQQITKHSLLDKGLVTMRLTTGATWVPSQRLRYFPMVSFIVMAAVLLSCTLVNVKLELFGENVSACCLLLPFVFIFSDAINELYGYRMTRNVIRATACGLLFLGALSHFTLEGLAANSESIYTTRSEFDLIVGNIYAYMYLSAAVLLVTDTFNAWLFRYLKALTHGHSLWYRSLVSNIIAQLCYCGLFALGYHNFSIFANDVAVSGTQPIEMMYNYLTIMGGVVLLLPVLYITVLAIRRLDTTAPAH